MKITGKTKVLGILGDPITHVASPVMHNALFNAMGIDCVYVPFKVSKDRLKDAINGLKALNVLGFNITIPHKVSILPYLDKIEGNAQIIGAINSVKVERSLLIGRNTDAEGALKALRNASITLEKSNVIIFGAGGAARAMLFSLVPIANKITIINRSNERLNRLLTDCHALDFTNVHGITFNKIEQMKSCISESNLIINSTSVGMYPNINQSVIPAEFLHSNCAVFDMVYNPLKTRLIQDASKIDCKIVSGLDMLVHQGAIAFEWWTGLPANINLMHEIVTRNLLEKR